ERCAAPWTRLRSCRIGSHNVRLRYALWESEGARSAPVPDTDYELHFCNINVKFCRSYAPDACLAVGKIIAPQYRTATLRVTRRPLMTSHGSDYDSAGRNMPFLHSNCTRTNL